MIENRNNDFKNSDGIPKVYSIFLLSASVVHCYICQCS